MRRTLFLFELITMAAAFAHGEEAKREGHWGDFTGRIAYDGKPPLARTIIVPFGGAPLIDESLMVNVDNGGIANVVVTLVRSRHALLPAHPSYEPEGEATVDLTIAAGRLDPHITLLRTTQLLQISNNLPGAPPIQRSIRLRIVQRIHFWHLVDRLKLSSSMWKPPPCLLATTSIHG